MANKQKPTIPPVVEWEALNTLADARRAVKWLLCSTLNGKTDVRTAGTCGNLLNIYIGCLKAEQELAVAEHLQQLESLLSHVESVQELQHGQKNGHHA